MMKKVKLEKLLKKYSGYVYAYPFNRSYCDFVRSLCFNGFISYRDYDLFVDLLHLLDTLDFRLYHTRFSHRCIFNKPFLCSCEENCHENEDK